MQTLVERGCGLDVHQATVVACLLIVSTKGKVQKQVRTFGTTTRELVSMREWLLSESCTHVAMESTGVYWKPIYAILEGAFEIVVANAQHVKKVPGRKTDVKDAEWIADLLCHGLLRSSFVPPKPIRELRDLTRYRRKLVESRSAERNRLLKLLETANIKLASVASDVFGVSGLLMLHALVEGKATAQEMAQLAKRQMRKKIPVLELALEGKVEEHHRFLLRVQLRRLQAVEEDLSVLEYRIQEKLQPYAAEATLLDEIPGVDETLAAAIIAEMGVDMGVFGSVSQLASWAGICPGNNESGGKRKSSRIPKGNVYLKTALVEAANAAAKAKGTYLRDKFYRLKARRGYKRAAVAVAHKILVAIYHILSHRVCYNELGDLYLDKLNKHHLTRNLVHRLERLGYTVTLEQKAA
ncbi:MAG TPA: IS110 family transposase [Candidatus Acidoferrales bacterium]|jgi:transposase|nr:IS110 family transposase [Candidatus Acidoferrales bacterium]